MPLPFHPIPEVVGEVPPEMFDDYQAVMEQADHSTGRVLDYISFANGLSDHEYRQHEALGPLINLIMQRETQRVRNLRISSSTEPLDVYRENEVDQWHRDGNTFNFLVGYMVAKTTGTEFIVPTRYRERLKANRNPEGPGLDITGIEGGSLIVQPRPLTVVRFRKQRHRRPTLPLQESVENPPSRPWLRVFLNWRYF